MTDHDECTETYRACTEARMARVAEVLADAEPWETNDDLARKANVNEKTIRRAKDDLLQKRTGVQFRNSVPQLTCEIMQFEKYEKPQHLLPLFELLGQVKATADRKIIRTYILTEWQL